MSQENLNNQEAIEKLQEMVNNIDVGMLCTYPNDDEYTYAVPMSRQEIDSQANIWYLFSAQSETYKHIRENNKVSILFSDPNNYKFLSINGEAEISQDQERIDKYWNKFVEAYFEKGKEDPDIRILKVKVKDAHYWDTEGNKFTNFLKIATNIIFDKKMEIDREGELNI